MSDQDDETRIGAYAPPADEFETFDAREEDARRGTFLLVTAIAVLLLFVLVVWSAFNQGVRERDSAPRLIAEVEPYRERPVDPGGEETPDTQLDVYNRLTGDADTSEDVSPRPEAEEPMEDVRPALRVETVDADAAAEDTAPQTPDVTPRPAPERPQRLTPPETIPETQAEPEPEIETPTVRVTETEPAASGPQPVTGGGWVVQIGSFRSESDAEAAWIAFQGRHGEVAAGITPDVARVDIPNRGVYHRLRLAAFSTRQDATDFCTLLQGRGQDCLAARR